MPSNNVVVAILNLEDHSIISVVDPQSDWMPTRGDLWVYDNKVWEIEAEVLFGHNFAFYMEPKMCAVATVYLLAREVDKPEWLPG